MLNFDKTTGKASVTSERHGLGRESRQRVEALQRSILALVWVLMGEALSATQFAHNIGDGRHASSPSGRFLTDVLEVKQSQSCASDLPNHLLSVTSLHLSPFSFQILVYHGDSLLDWLEVKQLKFPNLTSISVLYQAMAAESRPMSAVELALSSVPAVVSAPFHLLPCPLPCEVCADDDVENIIVLLYRHPSHRYLGLLVTALAVGDCHGDRRGMGRSVALIGCHAKLMGGI